MNFTAERMKPDPHDDEEAARVKSARRKWLGRGAQIALGLVVGCIVAEGGFCARDHRAFPHLNVYVADSALGVRLRPGATEHVAFGGNPVTAVRINADGLRGGPLSAPAAGEVLVLGDSQVFGLGVEEEETFSAQLRAITERPVVNAGIPTYGPLEYQATLEELMAKRHPRTIVYVVNMANDLLEATHPNSERHVVWDGWAVRRETAPLAMSDFPGRNLLFRESHAVFAIRRMLHAKDSANDDRPLPSEGTWHDLLSSADTAIADGDKDAVLAQWEADLRKATVDAAANQTKLQSAAQKAFPDLLSTPEGREYVKSNGHPSDIVSTRIVVAEAQTHSSTIKTVVEGARIRERIEFDIKRKAEAQIEKEESKAILASYAEREAIEKRIAVLRDLPAKLLREHSPMALPLQKAKQFCDANGARLVVVVLPMDVQVSADEWKKYGETPVDLAATRTLIDDVMRLARGLGASALDATTALSQAEPGAFLDHDLHMTPKGHLALAKALAATLAEPSPRAETVAANAPALGFTKACACRRRFDPRATCDGIARAPDIDCLRTYADDCTKLLACLDGEKTARAKCLPGWVRSGDKHQCRKACSSDEPCSTGKCKTVKEGRVCI